MKSLLFIFWDKNINSFFPFELHLDFSLLYWHKFTLFIFLNSLQVNSSWFKFFFLTGKQDKNNKFKKAAVYFSGIFMISLN